MNREMTDRELDAEVASKVFGLRLLGSAHCWQSGDDGRWIVSDSKEPTSDSSMQPVYADPKWNGEQCADEVVIDGVPACWMMVVDPYSSSIAHAWMVVEEMREQGWHVSITYYQITKQWCVFFWNPQVQTPSIRYSGPSIERAICGAALAALESERAK